MKSFKDFLSENPRLDSQLTKHVMRFDSDSIKQTIEQHHSKSEHLGDFNYVHRHARGKTYYHKPGGNIGEISMIDNNNVQHYVDKGNEGDSTRNHAFMKYHASKHGKVSSDQEQSVGGKQLWVSLIKSEPKGFTFHHVHSDGEEVIDKTNLSEKEQHIWGTSGHHNMHTVEMRRS